METKRKETPQERYHKKYRKQYIIACMTSTEMDIIDRLDSVENKSGYIKGLIREDIAKEFKEINEFKR